MLQEFLPDRRPKKTLGTGTSVCFQCKDALTLYHEFKSRGIQTRKRPFAGNRLWVVRDHRAGTAGQLPIVRQVEIDLTDRVFKTLQVLARMLNVKFLAISHFRPLLLAYRGRETGLRTEITLNRFQLSVLDSQILHIPEQLTVRGMAKIFHKSILRASGNPL